MALSFDVEVAPTPAVRRLRALAAILCAAGFVHAGWLAGSPLGPLAAILGLAAGWLAWRYGGRSLARGHLWVDDAGGARWSPGAPGAPRWADSDTAPRSSASAAPATEAGVARPVRIERWWATESLVWIRLGVAGERRGRDLVLARSGCDAARWRSLATWLAWLGRGGA